MTPSDNSEREVQRTTCILLGRPETATDAMLTRLARDFHPVSPRILDSQLEPCSFSTCVEYFRALGFEAFATTRTDHIATNRHHA